MAKIINKQKKLELFADLTKISALVDGKSIKYAANLTASFAGMLVNYAKAEAGASPEETRKVAVYIMKKVAESVNMVLGTELDLSIAFEEPDGTVIFNNCGTAAEGGSDGEAGA